MSWLDRIRAYRDSHFLIVLCLSTVLFFLVYASFYWTNNQRYPSPDEQANAVFAEVFAREGQFKIARIAPEDVVRPRSVNIVGNDFVPGFFLGLVLLAGFVGKWLGLWAIPLVPVALAAAAPAAYYQIARRVFDLATARLSTLLMFFLPAWAYYASRGFLPNVPMLSAYLIGWALLLQAHTYAARGRGRAAMAAATVAGLSFGLSFAIRPVEWIWAGSILLGIGLVLRKKCYGRLIPAMAAGFLIPVLGVAYWQQQTYGAWYATGYDQFGRQVGESTGASSFFDAIGRALFPFGFDPVAAFARFWDQVFGVYWWLMPFIVFGCFIYWKQHSKTREQKIYSTVFVAVSAYLILYYGSWLILDHPDPTWVSIGTAYHRYWLPVFVLVLPYLAMGLQHLALKARRVWPPAQSLPWAAVLAASILVTFALGEDSLGRLAANSVKYEGLRERVLASTPEQSVIASERQDKLFWPQRQVIHFADNDYSGLAESAQDLTSPLYVLSRLPASHAEVVEQRDFAVRGMRFEPVFSQEEFTLYRIGRLQAPQP